MNRKPPSPNIPAPTTPKGKATLARILDCGKDVFGESGYVSMRMSDLADRAKLSMGALYRYFDNKDDVFLAIIHDVHNELYAASSTNKRETFKLSPYDAILESNKGYLTHYRSHRKVMRSFIEATTVDQRYHDMWWFMRESHISRVAAALERDHHIKEINGLNARVTLEALASMTEQSAYVWFAQPESNTDLISVNDAARVVSKIWYQPIFS